MTRKARMSVRLILFLAVVSALLGGCSILSSFAPVAIVEVTRSARADACTVVLNGASSYARNGLEISSYIWSTSRGERYQGAEAAVLIGPSELMTVTLLVVDASGASGASSVVLSLGASGTVNCTSAAAPLARVASDRSPGSVTARLTGVGECTVSWSYQQTDGVSYQVQRRKFLSGWLFGSTWTSWVTIAETVTQQSCVDGSVEGGSQYAFRVRARGDAWESGWSETPTVAISDAPVGVTVEATGQFAPTDSFELGCTNLISWRYDLPLSSGSWPSVRAQ